MKWQLKADCVIEADSESGILRAIGEALREKPRPFEMPDRVTEGFIGLRVVPISDVGGPNGHTAS